MLPILSLHKSKGSSCPGTCHSHHPSREAQPGAYTSLRALPTGPVGGGLVLDSQIAWIVYCVDRCFLHYPFHCHVDIFRLDASYMCSYAGSVWKASSAEVDPTVE